MLNPSPHPLFPPPPLLLLLLLTTTLFIFRYDSMNEDMEKMWLRVDYFISSLPTQLPDIGLST